MLRMSFVLNLPLQFGHADFLHTLADACVMLTVAVGAKANSVTPPIYLIRC